MTTLTKTNSIHRSPLLRGLLIIPLVLACFALLPRAQAEPISPLVFAELPGVNTAAGFNVLDSLTTGIFNSGFGAFALEDTTTGSHNTALGAQALRNNTIGSLNTAVGENALVFNTSGSQNMAMGQGALAKNLTGSYNTAMGYQALNRNDSFDNVAVGFQALFSNTSGHGNTAVGSVALDRNDIGNTNTAVGFGALHLNTVGDDNTATGHGALFSNDFGNRNTATGVDALDFNSSGANNTATGFHALLQNTTGNNNTAIGVNAGFNLTTGNNNIDIGNPGVASESNTTRIGFVQTRTFIAGVRGRTTGFANAIPVLIDSAGQLGTASSSGRFKKEIKPMDQISEAILSLKPVTFHYKSDSTGTPQFGLIAEEVAKINPDLVVRDENGAIYTVRYDAVNAMLLNEFLKEHRKNEEQARDIQEQKATIALQQKQIDALTAGLQKVSAQLEASKPAPQLVSNP